MSSFRICSNCFGTQIYPYMGFMTGEKYQCQECEEILVMPIEFETIEDYAKFLISISPVVPHFSSECSSQLNLNQKDWPKIDEKFLIEENINIVVQFNGKKRGVFETKKDISEDELVKKIINSKIFDKILKENKVKKQFYVKNRLINLII